MLLNELIAVLNEIAPEALSDAYRAQYGGYDNTGLQLGDRAQEIKKVLLALEITGEIVEEAAACRADLIVTHHPFLYTPVNSIVTDTAAGRNAFRLIKCGIAVYSAHLNLDIALVNDVLANVLGICKERVLFPLESGGGLGWAGTLRQPATLAEYCERVKAALGDKTVFAAGDGNRMIKTAAVVGGGGGDAAGISRAAQCGADCYISADFKHHVLTEARETGLCCIAASHYALEHTVLVPLAEILKQKTALDISVSREKYPYV